MKKLVGIRGHRGAGKDSVSYLLACALDNLWRLNDKDKFEQLYEKEYEGWVKDLVEDKDGVFGNINFLYVYLDAFGDAPKVMVQQLLGCDFKYIQEEYWKDHAVVDLRTFDIEEIDKLPDDLLDPKVIKGWVPGIFDRDNETPLKMSLRDFILYFGINVMQKYFGQNVWVKSTAQNDKRNEEFFDDGIRIYTDVKAPTELSYLIDKQAVIVNVERKGYKKNGGLDLLKDDVRWDYNIKIKGDDLMSIKNDIKEIAEKIYYGEENY